MPSVYEIVTDKIIRKLEQGTIPWRTPWTNRGQAVSWQNQRAYRGINTMILDPGEYATYKQVQEKGGTVKKGEKGHMVVFWKFTEVENQETGKKETVPFLRYYSVFEINTQCEGLKSRRKEEIYEHNPIKKAEKIIEGYQDRPPITFASCGKAFYRPSEDSITLPPLCDYPRKEEYYSTAFHELVHSTGHRKRLNRQGVTDIISFGSETYSKEELIAEIGVTMLCTNVGIIQETFENNAAYIQSWLRKLKEDKRLIVFAAAQAQKAVDYIQGIKFTDTKEE